jgi:hypothetical protein
VVFGSMNFLESELSGFRPDIALIGAMPERRFIEDYTPRALERLQTFLAEVKAASPASVVMVPERLKPIAVDSILRK